jgi:hypothetical protein
VHCLLGGVEITEETNQRREHPARLGAIDGFHGRPRVAVRESALPVTAAVRSGAPQDFAQTASFPPG